MRMFRLAGLAMLAGCQTYSDKANEVAVVPGDYQALADCYYLRTANPRGFQKADLPSRRTVTITMGNADFTTMRLDFVGREPGRTEVRGYTNGLAFGASVWRDTLATVTACARDPATGIPPAEEPA